MQKSASMVLDTRQDDTLRVAQSMIATRYRAGCEVLPSH